MSIGTTLFPPSNREAATIAFLRTFWQVVRATGLLGGAGLITVSAADLEHINLTLVAYTVGAIILAGLLSGLLAAGDILVHGLPDAYTSNAIASVPPAIVTPVGTPIAVTPDIPAAPPAAPLPTAPVVADPPEAPVAPIA